MRAPRLVSLAFPGNTWDWTASDPWISRKSERRMEHNWIRSCRCRLCRLASLAAQHDVPARVHVVL